MGLARRIVHERSERVAVVTGGARGIGRAIGEWILQRSHVVVLIDRDRVTLGQTVAELGTADRGGAGYDGGAQAAGAGIPGVAVVDSGGFNAAARQLGVAAPSVHRMARALEIELDAALIDRSTRPLRATAFPAAYVERARALLQEMRKLDASLRDQARSPHGTTSLAAQSVVMQFILPELLTRFHARHSDIGLDIAEAGAERDLAKLGTDMLLQLGWPPPQDAILRTLAEKRWLVVAAPANARTRATAAEGAASGGRACSVPRRHREDAAAAHCACEAPRRVRCVIERWPRPPRIGGGARHGPPLLSARIQTQPEYRHGPDLQARGPGRGR